MRYASLLAVSFCLGAMGMTASDAWSATEAQCQALVSQDFSSVIDAPTHLMGSNAVPASADGVPAHCQVRGYVAPSIEFEIRLPLNNWNGKFLKRGCGGFCGSVYIAACNNHLKDGYACIASDMGHTSTGTDAKWAYNDVQAEIDFGYRATHVVTVAGKAITENFYGTAPQRSYFMGCSTGGRQGLVEAQRFPYDFDGIVAGAPVINETGTGMQLLWNVVANRDANGKQILPTSKLQMIHDAVIKKCDRNDGLEDGLIGDPRACDFEPSELQCGGRAGASCLTTAQVEVINKIYDGPVNSAGEALYTGGAQRGSELNWIGTYISEDGGPSIYENFMGDLWRYLGFMPDPGPSWQQTDFDFDYDYKRLGLMETFYSGSNPDLRKFKANGGKVLVYQGWSDQSVVPLNIIDYTDTVTNTMGGQAATQEFFRLFMIPGMNHCSGGEGAYAIDYLAYMEAWVEQGTAPDRVTGIHPKVSVDSAGTDLPLSADQVEFSRPAFPYPATVQYDGTGEPTQASSFVRVDP